ncbi:uncharacterized protein AB675_2033 [Cyphellophora attinorum]|uniref:Uncharacterized protein n=1 Tax=Cyphellophora attinorum TaxID=1664694 RepID=A0A0N1H7W5_9EURO|nr:uncharacterized protein AB675_2033 [Phialophora attinorum]KPI42793.1 hypothetical protein AB675_2033 [Phialophora attinorum]
MDRDPFVNYTHPKDQTDKAHKKQVAQYIGTHFRNRSRPTKRHVTANRPGWEFQTGNKLAYKLSPCPEIDQAFGKTHSELIPSHKAVEWEELLTTVSLLSNVIAGSERLVIISYAPSHLLRPEVIDPQNGAAAIRNYFQYALDHEVMFQATVALALADATAHTWTDEYASPDVLYHYGRSLSTLRRSLEDAQALHDDALLFAIMALIGIDYLLNDLASLGAHLKGLRHVIGLRGGLEAVGFPLLLKPAVLSVESFYSYIYQQPHLISDRSAQSVLPSSVGEPSPGEDETQNMLQVIPPGYHTLVGRSPQSPRVLSIVFSLAETDAQLHHDMPTSFAYREGVRKFLNFNDTSGKPVTVASALHCCGELAKLLVGPEMSQVERSCCIAMFIYLLGFSRSEQLSSVYFTQLQHHTQELLDMPLRDEDQEGTELIGWAMFVVSSTLLPITAREGMGVDNADKRYALALRTVEYFSRQRTWDMMAVALQDFIWNDTCMISWKNLWDTAINHLELSEPADSVVPAP